jgi:hypothetical protein|tara:strand:- start:307 stop:519 length:213 start_codon:yes stop_codon:yes gene_type:complete
MNFREIANGLQVATSNEEEGLLTQMETLSNYNEFTERQQFLLDNLVRKDIIKKVLYNGNCYLVNNAKTLN